MIDLVNATENEAQICNFDVAPWYYEQLAILYRKQGEFDKEIQILDRFSQQPHAPGTKPTQLITRLKNERKIKSPMKTCPNCQKELPEHALKCKYCDYRFTQQNKVPVTIPEGKSKFSIDDSTKLFTQTKKCHWCAMDIPIDASICPYCRKSTNELVEIGNNMMKTGIQLTFLPWVLLFLVFVFFMIFVLVK